MSRLLTGHVGERINRDVALVTRDFRLYHKLAPFFESMGITILGLAPGEQVPPSVRVLLDGPRDDARAVPVRPSREATFLAVRQALDGRRHVRDTGRFHRVVFGVDPGQVIGLAVLADGEVLLCTECQGAEALATRIAAWCTGLAADAWDVHVGNGDPPTGRAILAALQAAAPQLRRSLVSEAYTTPIGPATGSRHADAAIHIARREP